MLDALYWLVWISVDQTGLVWILIVWIAGGLYCWQNLLSVLLVISASDPDFISFVGPDTQEKFSWGSIEVAEWRAWAELGVWFFPIDAPWGGGLLCQERPLCNLKIIKCSQDVTLIPPIGLKSKDLEAFKFLYQEYDKDNKWQSENTGLSSFLKQEARQTAFWYIFKL